MAQFFFFSLMIITLIAGLFAYFSPSQKPLNPLQYMMDKTGYSEEVTQNLKKNQEFNIKTTNGLVKIRRQIDDLAQKQTDYLNSIRDQQEILANAGKGISDLMVEAKEKEGDGSFDVLQLKALTSQMQDQQRFMVSHGNDLLALNEQVTQNRQSIAEQIDLGKINTENTLHMLQGQYEQLGQQASKFFNKGDQYNQEIQDQMDKIQDQLNEMAINTADQQQSIKDRIEQMLEQQRENRRKLDQNREKNKNLVFEEKQKLADSQDLINESIQRNKDLIEDERQKQEDEQQRVADQIQRLKDQQNR